MAEETRSYHELAAAANARGIELPVPSPSYEELAQIVADAEASDAPAEPDGTEHHKTQTTEAVPDDDPIAGTIDDPAVVDPYAHLRKKDDEEG